MLSFGHSRKRPIGRIELDDQTSAIHLVAISETLPEDFRRRGRLTLLLMSILEDNRIDNLPAEDAPPAKEFLAIAIELLVVHDPAAFLAFHS